jgi:hypothetical protein
MERRTHESTTKLNKPLELHMRDTLDWDLWPGFAGARPVALVV